MTISTTPYLSFPVSFYLSQNISFHLTHQSILTLIVFVIMMILFLTALLNGPFSAALSLFLSFQQLTANIRCQWLYLNCRPLVLDATVLQWSHNHCPIFLSVFLQLLCLYLPLSYLFLFHSIIVSLWCVSWLFWLWAFGKIDYTKGNHDDDTNRGGPVWTTKT